MHRHTTSAVLCIGFISCCMACGPSVAPVASSNAQSNLSATSYEQVLDWTLGAETRTMPLAQAESALFWIRPGNSKPPQQLGRCGPIQDALPAPNSVEEVLFIVDGKLHRGSIRSSVELQPIETRPKGTEFSRLLTAARATPPVSFLAIIKSNAGAALWRFELQDDIAHGTAVKDDRSMRDFAQFIQRYRLERCKQGGRECLIAAHHDGTVVLDAEHRPGAPRQEVARVPLREVHRAWWQPDRGDGVYLLGTCPSKASSFSSESGARSSVSTLYTRQPTSLLLSSRPVHTSSAGKYDGLTAYSPRCTAR